MKLTYIPLFAESDYRSENFEKVYDISFCGTVHTNRPTWIGSFIKYAEKENLNIGLSLYYYSPILLFIQLVLNKWQFNLFSKVSYTPFSKKSIAKLFMESRAVLDLTHPNQNGLTSRTFEALRAGSKLITNNKNCTILDGEYPNRILILDNLAMGSDELLSFIKSDIKPLDKKQDDFLSIERFTDQLMENLND